MYQVTKWNLQRNVKSKSEILSYMKWLVVRFTAYLCVCMHYKCSRHKKDTNLLQSKSAQLLHDPRRFLAVAILKNCFAFRTVKNSAYYDALYENADFILLP